MKQEYHRALEQICLSEEARARIISVLEQKERGLKRPRRRIGRLILVCAVLILLLLGTGAAVVSRVGVLELFFRGIPASWNHLFRRGRVRRIKLSSDPRQQHL